MGGRKGPSLGQITRSGWPVRPWLAEAECLGEPEQAYGDFPEAEHPGLRERCYVRCMECAVFEQCRDAALDDVSQPLSGVMAGMTTDDVGTVRGWRNRFGVPLAPRRFAVYAASRGRTRWVDEANRVLGRDVSA